MGSRQRGKGITWAGEKEKSQAESLAYAKKTAADQRAEEARDAAEKLASEKAKAAKEKKKADKPKNVVKKVVAPVVKYTPSAKQQLIDILCLHGDRQTGEIFRGRLVHLMKRLRTVVRFHFIDAPFELPIEERHYTISMIDPSRLMRH